MSPVIVNLLPTQKAPTEESTPMDIALNNTISDQSIEIVQSPDYQPSSPRHMFVDYEEIINFQTISCVIDIENVPD